jgi:hypothetical protein
MDGPSPNWSIFKSIRLMAQAAVAAATASIHHRFGGEKAYMHLCDSSTYAALSELFDVLTEPNTMDTTNPSTAPQSGCEAVITILSEAEDSNEQLWSHSTLEETCHASQFSAIHEAKEEEIQALEMPAILVEVERMG